MEEEISNKLVSKDKSFPKEEIDQNYLIKIKNLNLIGLIPKLLNKIIDLVPALLLQPLKKLLLLELPIKILFQPLEKKKKLQKQLLKEEMKELEQKLKLELNLKLLLQELEDKDLLVVLVLKLLLKLLNLEGKKQVDLPEEALLGENLVKNKLYLI